MKHRVNYRKLGRKTSHRIAMLKNMTTSLIEHERIRTTVPKAKELRRYAEEMITLAKKGDQAAHLRATATVKTEQALNKLWSELAERYKNRNGGYTRIMRCGYREGDRAPMCFIEYIDRKGELRQCKGVTKNESGEDVVEPNMEKEVMKEIPQTQLREDMNDIAPVLSEEQERKEIQFTDKIEFK